MALLHIGAGAELQDENGSSDSLIAETFPSRFSLQRTTQSYTGELTYGGAGWSANAGFRVDHAEKFSTQFSPRVGFSYLFAGSGTRLHTTWGKGFKLPSFFALGDPNVGNPELRPETIRSFDAGLEQQLGSSRVILSLTYFYSRFENLIDFSAEEFRLVNRSSAISRGVEAEAKFQLAPNVHLGAHLNYVNAALLGTSDVLRDRPKWRGGLDVNWLLTKDLNLRASWISVGDRFDFQLPVTEKNIAPGYRTVDASFDWKIAKSFTLYSRIDNLLDNRFEEFVGFPNPGRYIRLGVKWNVKKM
jgi:Outer membrane cobalamin receptor protein